MSSRVHVREEWQSELPENYDAFVLPEGIAIVRSVSSATVRIEFGGTSLIRKHYVYSSRTALKAALRNTLVRPSRAEREFRMLCLFRERLGDRAVPDPIAFGEKRSILLLREAFLITLMVPQAVPLDEVAPDESDHLQGLGSSQPRLLGLGSSQPRLLGLGSFLARLHLSGLVHGSLFARNILSVPGGGYRVLDLDHADASAPGRLPPLVRRAGDLAYLKASLPVPTGFQKTVLETYAREVGDDLDRLQGAMRSHEEEARARIERRGRVRPEGRRPGSTE